jgi:prepilin-type N-terminal cleavage/methylation domain-containing protein
MSHRLKRSRYGGFTLIELLVVIAIIAILVALLLPAVQAVREAARKSQCQDHLHNIGIALHNYESSYKRLPQAASVSTVQPPGCAAASWVRGSGYSWRVMILPQMEQKPIYDQFNFSTTGYHSCYGGSGINNAAVNNPIDVYLCPSDETEVNVRANRAGTNYPGAVRARADQPHGDVLNDDATRDLSAITRSGILMNGFVDGTSNTIMVGEQYRGKAYYGCGSGGGSSFAVNGCTTNNYSRQRCSDWAEETGYCGVNAGVVVDTTLPTGTATGNPKQYRGVFAINNKDRDLVTWADSVNGGNTGGRPMSSAHPGGAQACMGDAKIRFINENIDFIVLASAFSAAGGEATNLTGN